MKIIMDRACLVLAMDILDSAPSMKTAYSGCVKLEAVKDEGKKPEAVLTVYDGCLWAQIVLGRVDVQDPGNTVVDAGQLRAIARAQDKDTVLTLETEEAPCSRLNIRGCDAVFRIFTKNDQFQAIPKFKEEKDGSTFTLPSARMKEVLDGTVFACANETSRYAMNGVLVAHTGEKVDFAATDGRRLALWEVDVKGKAEKPRSLIIPRQTAQVMLRLMDDSESTARIGLGNDKIFFSAGHAAFERAVLVSSPIEGTFPAYREVLPKDGNKKLTIERDNLLAGCKRGGLMTNAESRGVRLTLKKGAPLTIASRAPELGESEVNVEAEYDGEPLEIGFNPAFLQDAVRKLKGGKVTVDLSSPTKPGLIKTGDGFRYVFMPVNLS